MLLPQRADLYSDHEQMKQLGNYRNHGTTEVIFARQERGTLLDQDSEVLEVLYVRTKKIDDQGKI